MVAYTYRMPAGIPGEVSRFTTYGATIEQEVQNTSTPVTEYGVPVIVTSAGVRPLSGSDTDDTAVVGFSVRPFPGQDYSLTGVGSVPFGSGAPRSTGIIDILRRGYMTVVLGGSAAAARYGAVYAWYAASSGAHVRGHVEAANTGGSTFQLTKAQFMGPADANGNTEISWNI